MEFKLAYRILRKISDWVVDGFYSEVWVGGGDNIPRDGPLIVAASHHNEIIDIATLAVTIPHRRHLSFWAKSTMFANPVARAVLLSSGAIPVHRNPNNGNGNDNGHGNNGNRIGPAPASTPNQSLLFRESSSALAAGRVIGVFPEGTSYTEPSIMQVMPGAAWAAVEYAKWEASKGGAGASGGRGLVIVPVGIVYTDKARYQSRVHVEYGKPIVVDSFVADIFEAGTEDVDAASRVAVKKIMGEVEREMMELTINAPDWETMYAARTARDLLWGDERRIPLKDWVAVSQTLVGILMAPPGRADGPLTRVRSSLTKYYALLHYTGIQHAILESLIPTPPFTAPLAQAGEAPLLPILSILTSLPKALLSFLLFVPPFLFHVPGYIAGSLAGKYLAPKEEEASAEYKAVGGGLGLGAGTGVAAGVLWKLGIIRQVRAALFGNDSSLGMREWKGALGTLGVLYGSLWVLAKWHVRLVHGNYRRLQQILTFYKLFIGLVLGPSHALSEEELQSYSRPPLPPSNPFIRRKEAAPEVDVPAAPKPTAARNLIRHLLSARVEAHGELARYLEALGESDAVRFLRRKGGRVPRVG